MILLDTNILSEMMRVNPDKKVINWINNQDGQNLFISVINIAEINYGIYILPAGKRKQNLKTAFKTLVQTAFQYRILKFDEESAEIYAQILGEAKLSGKPMSTLDAQIAAIGLKNNLSLATHNIKHFQYCGIKLINPFDEP